MLLVIVDDVAVHMGVQVFVGLFFVVSEELTLVEWEDVSERPIVASEIVKFSLTVEVGSLWPGSSSAQ